MSRVGPAEAAAAEEFGGTGRRRGKSFVGNGILLEVEVDFEASTGCVFPLFQRTRALLVDLFDQVAEEAAEEREDEEDF